MSPRHRERIVNNRYTLVFIFMIVITWIALWYNWPSAGSATIPGDFSITLNSTNVTVSHRASATSPRVGVTIAPSTDFTSLVSLSFYCDPPEPMIAGSFAPNPTGANLTPAWGSSLRVGVASTSVANGDYNCFVVGTASPKTHQVPLLVHVVP